MTEAKAHRISHLGPVEEGDTELMTLIPPRRWTRYLVKDYLTDKLLTVGNDFKVVFDMTNNRTVLRFDPGPRRMIAVMV